MWVDGGAPQPPHIQRAMDQRVHVAALDPDAGKVVVYAGRVVGIDAAHNTVRVLFEQNGDLSPRPRLSPRPGMHPKAAGAVVPAVDVDEEDFAYGSPMLRWAAGPTDEETYPYESVDLAWMTYPPFAHALRSVVPVPPLARAVGYVIAVRSDDLPGADEAYAGVVVAVDRLRRTLRVRYEPDPAQPRRCVQIRRCSPRVLSIALLHHAFDSRAACLSTILSLLPSQRP